MNNLKSICCNSKIVARANPNLCYFCLMCGYVCDVYLVGKGKNKSSLHKWVSSLSKKIIKILKKGY